MGSIKLLFDALSGSLPTGRARYEFDKTLIIEQAVFKDKEILIPQTLPKERSLVNKMEAVFYLNGITEPNN